MAETVIDPALPVTPEPVVEAEPETPDEPLGDAGKKALAEERKNARAATRERDALAARLKEIEDRDKTEQQRTLERAEAAEKALAESQLDAMRSRVAISKGVPAELVDRLRGDTEADLAKDADLLLALTQPGKPRGDVAQGPRGTAGASGGTPADDFATFITGQLGR